MSVYMYVKMVDYVKIGYRYEKKQYMMSEIHPSFRSKAHLDQNIRDKKETTPELDAQICAVGKKRHIAKCIKSDESYHQH